MHFAKPSFISLLGISLFPALALAQTQPQRTFLKLIVNQVEIDQVVAVVEDQNIFIRTIDLKNAGIKNFTGESKKIKGQEFTSLKSLASFLTYKLNSKNLSLELTVTPDHLDSSSDIDLSSSAPKGVIYSQDTSFFFNYGFSSTNLSQYNLAGELGLSIGNSLLYSLVNYNWDGQVLRGLTSFTIDQSSSVSQLIIGDIYPVSDQFGSAPMIGGIAYRSNYALNPYLPRTPFWDFSTPVASPSTAEIYVNGQLVQKLQVQPGQFNLQNLLLPLQSSNSQIILKDNFGRTITYDHTIFVSNNYLRPGQSEFFYGLGFLRNNLNTENFSYGTFALLGTQRWGISDSTSIGYRFEATESLLSGGFSFTNDFSFGSLALGGAISNSQGKFGHAEAVSFSTSSRIGSLGVAAKLVSPEYANILLAPQSSRDSFEFNARGSIALGPRITLNATYSNADSYVLLLPSGLGVVNLNKGGTSTSYGLSLAIAVDQSTTMNISATRIISPISSPSNTIFLGINKSIGSDLSASVSFNSLDGQLSSVAQVQKTLPTSTGFGYNLQLQADAQKLGSFNSIQYQSPIGLYDLSLDRSGDQNTISLNISGGVLFIDNKVFLTKVLSSSFALIEVPGVSGGVRGYSSNQLYGTTNNNGDLILPNLSPYYANPIAINASDIPLDYTIDKTQLLIAPPNRGGAVVRFNAKKFQAIRGSLKVDKQGKMLTPTYGEFSVQVGSDSVVTTLGPDGQFYLENIGPGSYKAKIDFPEGICNFDLVVPTSKKPITKLGTLTCKMQ